MVLMLIIIRAPALAMSFPFLPVRVVNPAGIQVDYGGREGVSEGSPRDGDHDLEEPPRRVDKGLRIHGALRWNRRHSGRLNLLLNGHFRPPVIRSAGGNWMESSFLPQSSERRNAEQFLFPRLYPHSYPPNPPGRPLSWPSACSSEDHAVKEEGQ